MDERVIIVEGKTDKERLRQVLDETLPIYCTYGSYSQEKGEQLTEAINEEATVYIFTDEDESGKKLRQALRNDFPAAIHLHTRKEFGQVANTPLELLAEILGRAGFAVRSR